MRSKPLMMASSALLLAVVLVQSSCGGQEVEASAQVDWPMYRGNLAGTGYSPLAQITAANVAELTVGWNYSLRSDVPATAARAVLASRTHR